MTRLDKIPPGMGPKAKPGKASKPRRPVNVVRLPASGATMMTLPYPPSNNTYKRHICAVDPRHKVIAYVQDPAKRFLRAVEDAFMGYTVGPMEGPVEVTVTVWRPRRLGDIDNVLKVLLDALEGKAYVNDGQIAKLTVYRYDDPADPRAEVMVLPHKEFDLEDHL